MVAKHSYDSQLRRIIEENNSFMALLHAVRECEAPEWLVGAGVIRNLVWDHLHGYTLPTPVRDIDVAFFDPIDLSPKRDRVLTAQLTARMPGVTWEATNQAAVHLWYEQIFGKAVAPLTSSAEAVSTWPETATCVAVHLLPNDDLHIVAPFGLDDLFAMRLRRNPTRVTVEHFRRRLEEKQILQKWPRIQLIEP